MTDDDILARVEQYPARMVVLDGRRARTVDRRRTGGTPAPGGTLRLYRDQRHAPPAPGHRLGDLLAQARGTAGHRPHGRTEGGLPGSRPAPLRRTARPPLFPATLLVPEHAGDGAVRHAAPALEAQPANAQTDRHQIGQRTPQSPCGQPQSGRFTISNEK